MNQDLSNLHDLLCAQSDAIYAKMATAPDSSTMSALLTELTELHHRIDINQQLLFAAESQQLTASLKGITAANTDLTKALQTATTAADITSSVGKFLTLVDNALDLAKTLATTA